MGQHCRYQHSALSTQHCRYQPEDEKGVSLDEFWQQGKESPTKACISAFLKQNMGSHLSKYEELPLATASGGLEPLPTGGQWVRDGNTILTLRAKRLSWSAADCTIYEGDETGGKVLFKIAHNDLRDRAVFDANGVEIPTGYRRKMLAMLGGENLLGGGGQGNDLRHGQENLRDETCVWHPHA